MMEEGRDMTELVEKSILKMGGEVYLNDGTPTPGSLHKNQTFCYCPIKYLLVLDKYNTLHTGYNNL